jgi:superfamily II DNA helicase RecQ
MMPSGPLRRDELSSLQDRTRPLPNPENCLPQTLTRHRVGSMSETAALAQFRLGLTGYRGRQEEIVRYVTNGSNCLVLIAPTGANSLCSQLPSLLREGCAIAVSR